MSINNVDKLKSILSDKYEIVELIASGGMGEIYLGIHRALGQKRAIKIIHQTVEKEKDIRKRFLLEAQLAASIDHPGIIRIIDFGSDEDFDYLIMPYIDGETLQDKMEAGAYGWHQCLKMMIPMAEAISHAHKKNIIHRDIKPANFMIDLQGRIILTDFGISKNLGDVGLTATNTMLGSPKFMSPEQITGRNVDKRSDLYSLGMVFYQMVTGEYAFESDDIAPLMYKQVHEIPAHPSDVKAELPRDLGDIIMKLLAKEPDDRYPDGESLVIDLKKVVSQDASELKTIIRRPESKPGSDANLHEMATRIVKPLQKTIVKQKPKAKAPASATIVKAKKPGAKKKNRIWFVSAASILIICLVVIVAVMMVQKKHTTPAIHMQSRPSQVQPPHEQAQEPEIPPVAVKKSPAPAVTLRSRVLRENELIGNFEKYGGAITSADVKDLLKLKIGYNQVGEIGQPGKSAIVSFLEGLPYVRLMETGECDILIIYKEYTFGRKLTISSNLYACEEDCSESFVINDNQAPLNKIERILKRNYCFNAFSALSKIGSIYNSGLINLEVPGKIKNTFIVGEEVKFCMHPDFKSHCLLLDINIDGIYKLFPISEDQRLQLGKGETQCSIDIKVSPPVGNEMIVALGVCQKALISDYSLEFDAQNPLILWPCENGKEKNAIDMSQRLFLNLIQVPPESWGVNSKFIRILGND